MKKIRTLLLSLFIAVLPCSPAFAATNAETVTVTFDKVEDLVVNNPNYGSTGSQQIIKTRLQYLAYCNDLLTLDTNTITYNSSVKAADSAKKKLELGLISQAGYNDAMQKVDDQLNSQHAETNQRQQDQLTLRHMLALNDADRMVVQYPDYANIDLEKKLSTINYKKDLENWDLYDLSGANATDSEMTGMVETFQSLYNAVKLADQTYQSDSASYQKKQADAEKAQQKFKNGYAAQKDLDDIGLQVQKLADTVAMDKNSLFIAYLKYDFMRENGYAIA